MSCIFVVTPLVMVAGGWPVFCVAAAAVAANMGYRKLSQKVEKTTANDLEEVEVSMESSRVIAETLAEDEKFVLAKDGIEVEFAKDTRGRFSIHVRGKGIAHKKLQEEGEKLLGRIRQQYAYQRVMDELEKRGFVVRDERVDEGEQIRIRLERMGLPQ